MGPLLVTLGAGERCSSPHSFSHTVQVKPCIASITITALSLVHVGEVRGGRVSSKEGETKREAEGEGERELR